MADLTPEIPVEKTPPKIPDEALATLVVVGVLVLAVGRSLVAWAEGLDRRYRRGQLLAAYRCRHSWKKSDIRRLEALGVNRHAQKRMQRLAGRGRPVVAAQKPLEDMLVARINAFSLLAGPEGSPQERRRRFKDWPWWKHHVEAYYRGEYEIAKRQGMKSPAMEAEFRVGSALGMSASAIHSICAQIRRMRQEDELSANFPAETLADYERWMAHGAHVFFRIKRKIACAGQ
ncbi:hypothetical protein [Bradyrhizobium sp. CCGUVB23]|uniref:hypothetical protein n=1 Tax=Bradyrhizobium sp. CCGUVB23 TaxID=2949630 RepID=UPI0020B30F78|nr:hypothetical protein [Bradyrhizobium sp. CCGUVB23]MCP3463083.1 hypothetical protein [Bradyrhizobium sp. CCGUVB23]